MKISFYSIGAFALFSSFAIVSCNKGTDQQVAGCDLVIAQAYLPFNVVDSNTGQDLYFSSAPKYQTSNLIFFSKKDKTRKDTIRPVVTGTGTSRYFMVPVNNTVTQDTLLMKLASNPDDVIAYTIKKGGDTCPTYVLDKVFFNGTQLNSNQSKYIFNKQ
jgi:hypothetical protein